MVMERVKSILSRRSSFLKVSKKVTLREAGNTMDSSMCKNMIRIVSTMDTFTLSSSRITILIRVSSTSLITSSTTMDSSTNLTIRTNSGRSTINSITERNHTLAYDTLS